MTKNSKSSFFRREGSNTASTQGGDSSRSNNDNGRNYPTSERSHSKPHSGDRPSFSSNRDSNSFNSREDRPARPFGNREDRPARAFGNREDRPARAFGNREDRPARAFGNREDRPARAFGNRDDRPARSFGNREDRPARAFGNRDDRAARAFGNREDRPARSFGNREDRPAREFGNREDRPARAFGNRDDRPARSFGNREDRPARAFGNREDRPARSFGNRDDRAARAFGNREDRPARSFGNRDDRPARSFGNRDDRPARSFGNREDRPARSFGNREDRPARAFGNRDDRPAHPFERREKVSYSDNYQRTTQTEVTPKVERNTEPQPVRLNRFIAQSGVCSRREADELITNGEITVNGVVVTELGTKVMAGTDNVAFGDKVLSGERLVYILMNKPKGYVTSVEDPHNEETVISLLKGRVPQRVYPVGRLDKNTTGVLLLTNDGELTRELTHPSFEKSKIYHVFLDQPCSEEHLEMIAKGIELEDGEIHADEVSYVEGNRKEVGIELHSGRNRIVRRIFEHLGYRVVKLDRVYFAGITKSGLRRGFWRELEPREVMTLKGGQYK